MALLVGDNAPDFTLKSNSIEDVALSSFLGKQNVVLLFFPLANTGTCEKELCTMRDSIAQYEDLDAQVLAVSVDSPFVLKLWGEQQRFNFPLLSDFNKRVSQKYDAFYDNFLPGKFDYRGVAKRSAYVIDKEGIIKYAEVLDDPSQEPSYEGIQEALKSL